jgi:hypothetical protein
MRRPSLTMTSTRRPRTVIRLTFALLLPLCWCSAAAAPTQPAPVAAAPALEERPAVPRSMNRHYLDADVEQWRGIFESVGREVFDRRFQVVQGPRPARRHAGRGRRRRHRLVHHALRACRRRERARLRGGHLPELRRGHRGARRGLSDVANVVGIVNTERSTELPPGSVDLVFLADTYHHFSYPRSMLASIHHVPGAGR